MSEVDLNGNEAQGGAETAFAGDPLVAQLEWRRRAVRVSHAYFRNRLGIDVGYSIYRPRSGDYQQVLVVAPELGVPRAAYDRFAAHMGFDHVVVTFDAAGIGDSRLATRRKVITMHDWASDLNYLVTLISDQFGRDVVGVGHGLGGALFGLCGHRHIGKLVLVAAADPYYRLWPRSQQPLVLGRWAHAYANALAGGVLTWRGARRAPPAPAEVVRTCAQWSFTGSLLRPRSLDAQRENVLHQAPALVVFADDDRLLAPRGACLALADKLAPTETELLALFHWDWAREGIRHFGYFHDVTGARLWNRMNRWICA
ncbi:alpha/beta fold hydrolase [Duganella vulcania]|uniref:Alpha/beta fold hydrolase n=1 Tax=Duganella vulcania TaxID=2692166 RepID=A0A845GCL5_9BURK|nr:alpha/beta fold hydrolase [Duganella vulcania]MYM92353.1 hypothetical protein [Duganella vulcania]